LNLRGAAGGGGVGDWREGGRGGGREGGGVDGWILVCGEAVVSKRGCDGRMLGLGF